MASRKSQKQTRGDDERGGVFTLRDDDNGLHDEDGSDSDSGSSSDQEGGETAEQATEDFVESDDDDVAADDDDDDDDEFDEDGDDTGSSMDYRRKIAQRIKSMMQKPPSRSGKGLSAADADVLSKRRKKQEKLEAARISNSTMRDRISSSSSMSNHPRVIRSSSNADPRSQSSTNQHRMDVEAAAQIAEREAAMEAEEKRLDVKKKKKQQKEKEKEKQSRQLKKKVTAAKKKNGGGSGNSTSSKAKGDFTSATTDLLAVSAYDLQAMPQTLAASRMPYSVSASARTTDPDLLHPPHPHMVTTQTATFRAPAALEQPRSVRPPRNDESNLRMRISCMPTSFSDARGILGPLAIVANATCLNYELGIRMATLAAWEMITTERTLLDDELGFDRDDAAETLATHNNDVIPHLIDQLECLSGSFAISGCEVFQGCHAARGLVVRALAAILFCENISRARSASEMMDITEAFKHACNSTGHALQADETIPPPIEGLPTPDPAYGIMASTANSTHYYLLLLSILVKNSQDVPVPQARIKFNKILEWLEAARVQHARPDASSWFNMTIKRMISGLSESNIVVSSTA